jgi:hypothetical protein
MRPLLAVLLLVALSACVSGRDRDYYAPQTGAAPPRAQDAELARIYFYRPEVSFLMAAAPFVVVNGRRVGTLRNGEAFFRDARPGRYEVHLSSSDDDVIALDLAAGETAYVRAEIAWRMLGFRLVAAETPAEAAEPAVATLPLVTGLEADLQRRDPEPPDLEPAPGSEAKS